MMRARMGTYAGWQLLDFVRERGIAITIVGVLLGAQFVANVRHMGAITSDPALVTSMLTHFISVIITPLAPLFTILAVNRIVANDRTSGYYRFLFAKPVSLRWYYAQLFVIYGIGLMLSVAVLGGLAWAFGVHLPILALLEIFGVSYIAMGGIGFFFSVLTRFDWQAMIAMWFGAYLLYTVYGDGNDVRAMLVHVLPPAHLAGNVYSGFLGLESIPAHALIWLLAYGVVCFVLGVALVRRRPLSA